MRMPKDDNIDTGELLPNPYGLTWLGEAEGEFVGRSPEGIPPTICKKLRVRIRNYQNYKFEVNHGAYGCGDDSTNEPPKPQITGVIAK